MVFSKKTQKKGENMQAAINGDFYSRKSQAYKGIDQAISKVEAFKIDNLVMEAMIHYKIGKTSISEYLDYLEHNGKVKLDKANNHGISLVYKEAVQEVKQAIEGSETNV